MPDIFFVHSCFVNTSQKIVCKNADSNGCYSKDNNDIDNIKVSRLRDVSIHEQTIRFEKTYEDYW